MYVISMFHILFSFLAFKNEIGFWHGRENVAGLSRRSLIGNAIFVVIIFLYLWDTPGTSFLVLGTTGISVLIELWKVMKVMKFSLFGTHRKEDNVEEKETEVHDIKGMYYLSMVLFPLVIGWSIYSLLHYEHRGWFSWLLSCAANGVYAFGFLMMTPQIFINYKLKSVAHMPWRSMTYKVFRTFVDDIFALMIEMPTAHKLATLRDDLVFLVYLYQYWIYPVDKTRPNEFGYVFSKDPNPASGVEKEVEKEEAVVSTQSTG
eukprot:TRINITY_DN9121_c0_g1_i8.p1 TRINITY_DN9121_c0_g1~~TRINITY_DN9121_c0_g1_i8.p1  ORF type:complete len:261 (+),score=65.29 TRINITY_DN9121_c0_g1_i8:235-1017(+)